MEQAMAGLSAYPLKNIPAPHPHDVLCGRGGGTNNHIGNSHWRMLVAANKQLYITLPKRQKMLLSRSIVNAVRSQDPPGRFLQKDSKSNFWFDVGDQRAQEKTSQALREGAPDIRSKTTQNEGEDGEEDDDDVEATLSSTEEKTNVFPMEPTPALSSAEVRKKQQPPPAPPQQKQQVLPKATTPKPSAVTVPGSKGSTSPKPGSSSSIPPPQQAPPPVMPPAMHSSGALTQGSIAVAAQAQAQAASAAAAAAPPMMNTSFMMPPVMAAPNQMQPGPNSQFVMNGGAPSMQSMFSNQMNQNGHHQGMLYYAGPNMAPMQVYPTMVLNEQGILVPAMSVVPTMMHHNPHMMGQHQQQQQQQQQQHQQHQQSQHQQQFQQQHYAPPTAQQTTPQSSGAVTPPINNQSAASASAQSHRTGSNSNSNYAFDPLPANSETMTFDDYMATLPPGALEPAGLSFGSIDMTDADHRNLESTERGFGNSMSSYGFSGTSNHQQQQYSGGPPSYNNAAASASAARVAHHNPYLNPPSSQGRNGGDDEAPPAIDSLEPTGISFGDVSMMSAGTKLENTGVSFGSMMSYSAVDGGLEAIGTSFGSLSLDMSNKESLFKSLELAAGGPVVPPMFQAQRSTGNLLECSDTESEDSDQNYQLVAQKSNAWESMQATFAAQRQQNAVQLQQHQQQRMIPPPQREQQQQHQVLPNFAGGELLIPMTNLEPNFSALSAWENEDGDDDDQAVMPPPPPMEKQDSDGEKLEMFYLQRGPSLGDDHFQNNNVG